MGTKKKVGRPRKKSSLAFAALRITLKVSGATRKTPKARGLK